MNRTEAVILRAFALWTAWVWGTRIGNVMSDHTRSAGFKAVHVFLAIVSVAFAVATWIVVRRVRIRESAR